METPSPTIEEYVAIGEMFRDQARKLTPDRCPYFHAIISNADSQDSVKVAWVSHIQLLHGHVFPGADPLPLPRERPDQVAILPDPTKELHRFTVAATHFFVTDDGALCCLVPRDNPKAKSSKTQSASYEALILLEGDPTKAPPTGFMGDVSFSYAIIRDAVKARNQLWSVSPPAELKGVIEAKWQGREAQAEILALREMAHPLQSAALTQIPNDPASVFVMNVLAQKLAWQTNENECHKFAQKGKSLAIYRPEEEIPDDWANFRESVLQTLEARFTAMKGELVADVADILFWHWLSNNRPAYAGITLSQILEYRGVKPRPNVIEEHWQAMRDVRSIKLRGGGIESESLFHISAAQPNLFGATEPPKLETVYRYHPGYFLSEAIQRDAFFLAYMARNVWQLDYYRDANAKRLARVLRAEWRRNAESYLPGGKPRYRTWRALLDESGIDHENGRAKSNPAKFIKAIEAEIEKLYQNEFIRECAPVIYHPDDRKKRENLPTKGVLMAWLGLRTHIAPAADITDVLTQTATRQLARKAQIKALAEGKKSSPKRPKKA